jgi:hypothetical protein
MIRAWITLPPTKNPTEEDTILSTIIIATKRLISRAQQTSRREVIRLASLEYVNRKETGELSNQKPLNS